MRPMTRIATRMILLVAACTASLSCATAPKGGESKMLTKIRAKAAKDFACAPEDLKVEPISSTEAGSGNEHYQITGCGWTGHYRGLCILGQCDIGTIEQWKYETEGPRLGQAANRMKVKCSEGDRSACIDYDRQRSTNSRFEDNNRPPPSGTRGVFPADGGSPPAGEPMPSAQPAPTNPEGSPPVAAEPPPPAEPHADCVALEKCCGQLEESQRGQCDHVIKGNVGAACKGIRDSYVNAKMCE